MEITIEDDGATNSTNSIRIKKYYDKTNFLVDF
jgi:hypothetical protein